MFRRIDIAAFAAALSLAVGAAAQTPSPQESLPDGYAMGRGMEVLVNMFRDIELFYVDPVDPNVLLNDAAAGMTSRLDPYTDYISEEDMKSFRLLTTGRYGGVGSIIRQNGDWVIFAEPYRDSPADRAGIGPGDRIVEIAGQDGRGLSTARVSELLKGEPGTRVKLKVVDFYTDSVREMSIRREIINIPGIPYYGMVSDSTGYILNVDFTEDVSSDMRNAVMALREAGAKSLILDYRNNGGGIVQEAVKMLSFFLPRGTEVVSLRGRNEEDNAVFVTEDDPIAADMPLAVLVNNGSASAAEIMAGALQDLDRAVVLGRRTFGKGLVQSTLPLGYNAYLKVTTAKYYLPSGRCVQAIDYARRDDTGALSYIPDSLVNEFSTRAGRRVYDGGGVMPDVNVPAEYVSRFAAIVYGKGYVHDFVDGYLRARPDLEVVPGEFELGDAGYAEFGEFMKNRDVQWESESRMALEALRARAADERYLDSVADLLDEVEARLTDDAATGLELYRDELVDLIEGEIVLRKCYNEGVVRHGLGDDPDVRAAVELLGEEERYRHILTEQDTARK